MATATSEKGLLLYKTEERNTPQIIMGVEKGAVYFNRKNKSVAEY